MGEGGEEDEVLAGSHQWSCDAVQWVRGGFAVPALPVFGVDVREREGEVFRPAE